MADTFSKLVGDLITSSIWSENDDTRIVWVTMLALKDEDGFVSASLSGLANSARKTIEQTRAALDVLEGPDLDSRTKDNDGKRVLKVDGGWMVLNHFKYRDKERSQKRKEYLRDYMREYMQDVRQDKSNESLTTSNLGLTSVSVSSSLDQDGECEGKMPSRYSDAFLAFWAAYPKKKGKGDAWKAWKQVKPAIDECLKALEWQKRQSTWVKDGGQFIPHPGTWLRASRWEDEPDGKSAPPSGTVESAVKRRKAEIEKDYLSGKITAEECDALIKVENAKVKA